MEVTPIAAGLIVAMAYALMPRGALECEPGARVGTPCGDEVQIERELSTPDTRGVRERFTKRHNVDELGNQFIVAVVEGKW